MRQHEAIPLDLFDHELQIDSFGNELDRFEDISTGVAGQFEDGQHFMLLEMVGITKGRSTPDGYYVGGNAAGHQTMLVLAQPTAWEQPMANNNFIRKGWLPNQVLGVEDLRVTKGRDSVTWAIGPREHVFRLGKDGKVVLTSGGGVYANVSLALTHRQRGDVIRWGSPRWGSEDARKLSRAAYHAIADVSGTIRIDGKEHKVARGVSVVEHISMCEPLSLAGSVPADQPAGWYWAVGGTPEFMVYASIVPQNFAGAQASQGIQVVIDGRSIDFRAVDGDSIRFEPCQWWHDLRSGILGPCTWQAAAAGPQGALVLSVEGFHRGYYVYTYGNGTVTITWTMARLSGAFHFPDGRAVRMPEGATLAVEWGKRTYSVEETLEGPVTDLRSRSN